MIENTIKRLQELKHDYDTSNLNEYGKMNLVCIVGEMLLSGNRLQEIVDYR